MERVVARIAKDPRNQDPVQQFAVESALRMLFDAGVVDPGADAIIAALSRKLE
ncbi:MAG: hypothetical protein HY430_02435 [Candidatus Levybacteria bacterium]|nr:hypothetical protein [Candidatus Levybacteria bacterium]